MMQPRLLAAIAFTTSLTAASLVAGAGGTSVRAHLLGLAVTSASGGATTRPVAAQNAFSFAAPNALREHQRIFSFGNRLFNTNWVMAPASVKAFDGLGPLFNRVSCSGCHTKDGRGQPPANGQGPMESMLFRISIPGTGDHGGPRPVPGYGDQLSERGNPGVVPEGLASITYKEVQGSYGDGETFSLRAPTYSIRNPGYGTLPQDLLISPRVAPHMIGLGLLEAVPDATLEALADPDDADGDGVSGRTNKVWDSVAGRMAIGRFGWKAGQPSLRNQNAGAALGDIGLTTTPHPVENCDPVQTDCSAQVNGGTPEMSEMFLDKLTLYTQSLAVPAQRAGDDASVAEGAALFRSFGCSSCHMPTLQSAESPLPDLSNQTFHPYTDLLLHDMGEGLADNRPDFEATGREWRTPPLWGLGVVPTVNGHNMLLHDGRARGFAEAILWHGGEAQQARDAFRTATKDQRDALVAFLSSL